MGPELSIQQLGLNYTNLGLLYDLTTLAKRKTRISSPCKKPMYDVLYFNSCSCTYIGMPAHAGIHYIYYIILYFSRFGTVSRENNGSYYSFLHSLNWIFLPHFPSGHICPLLDMTNKCLTLVSLPVVGC